MQLKSQISFLRYAILTALHVGATFYFVQKEDYFSLIIVFLAIIFNQLCLIFATKMMIFTDADKRDNGLIFLLFALKFLTLAGGIYYGFYFFSGNKLVILLNYIFQLKILILSIKRYSKKN
jgi:hypothetical protein